MGVVIKHMSIVFPSEKNEEFIEELEELCLKYAELNENYLITWRGTE